MNDVEKPRSKSSEKCPHFQKQMRHVCHTCNFWQHIKGHNPQTGEPLERWGCVIVHNFMLQLENNKVTYEQGAAIESLRNEMVEYQRIALRVQYRDDPIALKVIEGEFVRLDQKQQARLERAAAAPQLPKPTVVEALQPDERREFPQAPARRRKTA